MIPSVVEVEVYVTKHLQQMGKAQLRESNTNTTIQYIISHIQCHQAPTALDVRGHHFTYP